MKKATISSDARTAIGTFIGSLREVPVELLGAMALHGALECSNLNKDQVADVIMGQALPSDEVANIARVCLLLAGLRKETPVFPVCRMRASGIQGIECTMQSSVNSRNMYSKGALNV